MKEKLGKKSNKASVHDQNGDSSEPTKSFMAKKSINTEIEHDVKEQAVYMDTASDVHTLWDRTKFTTYEPCNDSLSGINGQSLRVEGTGSVRYPVIVDGKLSEIILTNVHHVPAMDYNLLSIATLEQKGCSAAIANGRFDIIDDSDDEKILSGTRVGTSYLLDLKYSKTPHALKSSYNLPANHGSWDQWHQRLAHLNMQDVKKLASMSIGINVPEADRLQKLVPAHDLCEPCMMGKQTKEPSRQPRRQTNKRETIKGAYLHSDLAGGGKIKRTLGGHAYVESFVDDATDMTFISMLKRKSDAPMATKNHINWMSNQGHPVNRFSTDNENIYAGYEVQDFLKLHGIQWEPSTPYNPSQNPVAERTFRTLFERVRSVLNDAGLPQFLWGEALNFVEYCKNRSPTKALNGKTPYEAWYGSKPQLGHMHAFGCIAYMYDTDPALKKLDNKSKKCRLLGYEGSNQYRLWNPKDRKVYRASWVRFDDIATLSKEMGASTDDSWDFFSEFSNDTELSNDTDDFFSHYSGETAVNSPVTTPVLDVEAIPEAGSGLS